MLARGTMRASCTPAAGTPAAGTPAAGGPARSDLSSRRNSLPLNLLCLLILVPAAGAALFALAQTGPMARMMAGHILLMNVVAPLLAVLLRDRPEATGRALLAASLLQLTLLWAVHLPAVMAWHHHSGLLPAFGALLLASAFWFWRAVLGQTGARRWRGLLALLLTGKLYCLLGVLLVFAPRPLYPGHASQPMLLADQQQAGLLMVVACPLSYVLAAVIIAAGWISALDRESRRPAAGRNEPAAP